MMFEWSDHMSGWGWAWMALSSLVLWGIVIAAVIVLVRHFGSSAVSRKTWQPDEILAQRFARGEIDEAEYGRRLAALRDRNRTTSGR